jgi:DNA-binding IclR family transcriptional regulator
MPPHSHPVRIARLIRRIKDGDLSINTGRKSAILTHLHENQPASISRSETATLLEVDVSLAFRLLDELVDQGSVRRVGTGSRCRYELTETPE